MLCMPGKDVKVDAILAIDGGTKLPSGSNRMDCFRYKGKWAKS